MCIWDARITIINIARSLLHTAFRQVIIHIHNYLPRPRHWPPWTCTSSRMALRDAKWENRCVTERGLLEPRKRTKHVGWSGSNLMRISSLPHINDSYRWMCSHQIIQPEIIYQNNLWKLFCWKLCFNFCFHDVTMYLHKKNTSFLQA